MSERDPLLWQLQGLCQTPRAGADWFARKNSPAARQAKRWCAICPVRQDCLDFGLRDPGLLGRGLEGIWGGTDEEERAWLRDPQFDEVWTQWSS